MCAEVPSFVPSSADLNVLLAPYPIYIPAQSLFVLVVLTQVSIILYINISLMSQMIWLRFED